MARCSTRIAVDSLPDEPFRGGTPGIACPAADQYGTGQVMKCMSDETRGGTPYADLGVLGCFLWASTAVYLTTRTLRE